MGGKLVKLTGLLDRISQDLGLVCYGAEGVFASYLLFAPILRGQFGTDPLGGLIAWAIASGSLIVWWAVFRKESRERAGGKLPPLSGNTPRLAIMVLICGAFLGSIMAVAFK